MVSGRDLRAARQASRVSLGKLAQRIGRDKGHLSRVERGLDSREVTPALVRDYERALGTTIGGTIQTTAASLAGSDSSQRHPVVADAPYRLPNARGTEVTRGAATSLGDGTPAKVSSEPFIDDGVAGQLLLRVRVDGREVVVPLNRRAVLRGGLGSILDILAVNLDDDAITILREQASANRVTITSQAHLNEILTHLREQWHALVRTDNLLGPRFAVAGVCNHVAVIDSILATLHHSARNDVVRVGAQYAESAAWLYQDAGDLPLARHWTGRAMEWAYEADDKDMLAWTTYRRSQQAALTGEAAQAIGLARAARRDEERLRAPMRAAIRVQEADGHALAGDETAAQRLLDEAHDWTIGDLTGDARGGHGSFCTPGYIEMHRGDAWLTLGNPAAAIEHYEQALPLVPSVYQRDRAAGLSRLATAYARSGQPEQAARTAREALPIARSAGSPRIMNEIQRVVTTLEPHSDLPPVAELLEEVRQGAHN